MTEEFLKSIVENFYSNNGSKVRNFVHKILTTFKFTNIYQKDYDDFYSVANEVFSSTIQSYDDNNNCKFDTYFYHCLENKIKTEITKRNRIKRQANQNALSLDASCTNEDDCLLKNIIPSDYNLEDEVMDNISKYGYESCKYLSNLSNVQKEILSLKIRNKSNEDIMKRLNLSEHTFNRHLSAIKSFDKIHALLPLVSTKTIRNIENEINMEEQKMGEPAEILQFRGTQEISKTVSYTIASYSKQLKRCQIRGDHPLQRNSEQWRNKEKYDLITTILNDYPIPEVILAEQRDNGISEVWLIDGKQRLTNLESYHRGLYRIGKTAERAEITYQVAQTDEHGNVLRDRNGTPIYDVKSVDVRGKFFSELPEELQDRFCNYTINATKYLQCSDDDIEYHIRRYNASKPMTAAQKGITHIGEQCARLVKNIAQNGFLKEKCNFKVSEFSNGTIDRVITESLMATNFLNDWKSTQEGICVYLKENITRRHFDEFEDMLNRLDELTHEESEYTKLFNSKDTFIYLAAFSKFIEHGKIDDERFVEFMEEFNRELKDTPVLDGKSYVEIAATGTKHKGNTTRRIHVVTKLMFDYLGVKQENSLERFNTNEMLNKYIEDFSNIDIIKNITTDKLKLERLALKSLMILRPVYSFVSYGDKNIQSFVSKIKNHEELNIYIEDCLLTADTFNDWTLECDNNSPLFKVKNISVFLLFVQWVYEHNEDENIILEWFINYVDNYELNGEFDKYGDAKVNEVREKFNILVESFERYSEYEKNKKSLL